MSKNPALRKAVKRLQYVYINSAPFYSEDGQSVRVDIQDKRNGVLQEPFTLAIEVDDTKPAGLRIRRSGVEWTEQESLTPGILIPSDKEYKAQRKAERANAPQLSDRFTTLPNPDDPTEGDHWEHHQVKDLPLNNVWTIVEGDSGKHWWALTGFHIVNKLFYVVTKEPWTDEDSNKEFRY